MNMSDLHMVLRRIADEIERGVITREMFSMADWPSYDSRCGCIGFHADRIAKESTYDAFLRLTAIDDSDPRSSFYRLCFPGSDTGAYEASAYDRAPAAIRACIAGHPDPWRA